MGSQDYARKVSADSDGNVIVAGYTDDGVNGKDFLIIKYSGAGAALWTNRYNGPANTNDQATALAVDGTGNVFVTGESAGVGSSFDYVTLAYSSAGVPLWTNYYNGPGNLDDQASAIDVDESGNVFVTGQSIGTGSGFDYAIVCYSGKGAALWTNRYHGPGGSTDSASALAVDGNGGVVVTGQSTSALTALDYATVAYSGGGTPLWTNRYTGPANYNDSATALVIDRVVNNVFVTGRSVGIGGFPDYATVAYSAAGVPLWTNRYSGGSYEEQATALAVDGTGNVFVTGYSQSSNSLDYATIAYSGGGAPLWTNRYDGPARSSDSAFAIFTDPEGNVFVTGQSTRYSGFTHYDYATVAYSGSGVPLWTNRYDGPGNGYDSAASVTGDGSGNVFVTGSSQGEGSLDYVTIAYSGAGTAIWTNRYNVGPGNAGDAPAAVAVDSAGNVFVTGGSVGLAPSADYAYATVAYSNQGMPLWTNRYNGTGRANDGASAIAVDHHGNVFVTGYSLDNNNYSDYATIAYSGAGVPLWTNRYNGAGNAQDRPSAMAVDRVGNVFVTGYSDGSDGWRDYATIAYSGVGMPLWTNRYSSLGRNNDSPTALAVNHQGNVFVTGENYATVAYSADGMPLWTNRYSGPGYAGQHLHLAVALAVDRGGSVYVTGQSMGSDGNSDYATVAYSGAGMPLWTNRYNGPGNFDDQASGVAVDANGNVFVTGQSVGSRGFPDFDYATLAYSAAGMALWTNRYAGPGNSGDYATVVVVGPSGNVYVTGRSMGSDGSYDYATVAYSGTGLPLSTNRYNSPGIVTDYAYAMAVDGKDNVFVTGYSYRGKYLDYVTIKYSTAPYLTIEPDGTDGYFIRFTGSPGTVYSLESATRVTGPWASGPLQTVPSSGWVEFRETSPLPARAFYRVRTE